MAIANAVGSNIFDIWFGLGLPWAIVLAIKEPETIGGGSLLIDSIILGSILVAYLVTLMCSGWRMTAVVGWTFMGLYLLFVIYQLVFVWALDILDEDPK